MGGIFITKKTGTTTSLFCLLATQDNLSVLQRIANLVIKTFLN